MPLQRRAPVHTGSERYVLPLVYSEDEVRDIERLTPVGQIIVDTVTLVWTREVGGKWQRLTHTTIGSHASGREKISDEPVIRGPRKAKEIFDRDLGALRDWTTRLPGLRTAIDEAEADLPG